MILVISFSVGFCAGGCRVRRFRGTKGFGLGWEGLRLKTVEGFRVHPLTGFGV